MLYFQGKYVIEIEKQLNGDLINICEWFVDNRLIIHFGEDKTKSILFASKRKIKRFPKLKIKYENIQIKQHSKVTYLGCILDETMSGELMALKVIHIINSRLNFCTNSFREGSQQTFVGLQDVFNTSSA